MSGASEIEWSTPTRTTSRGGWAALAGVDEAGGALPAPAGAGLSEGGEAAGAAGAAHATRSRSASARPWWRRLDRGRPTAHLLGIVSAGRRRYRSAAPSG